MTWVSGDVWQGVFKQGLLHGQGTYRSSSGVLPFVYHGSFVNGKFEGFGSCRYRDDMRRQFCG
jgi:hypothetical protein